MANDHPGGPTISVDRHPQCAKIVFKKSHFKTYLAATSLAEV